MRLKISLDQEEEDLMLGAAGLVCALVSIAVILIDH
jgi:hypothetical protein